MLTEIGDQIEVVAAFKTGMPRPIFFFWSGRKYKVSSILGMYKTPKGKYELIHYSISARSNGGPRHVDRAVAPFSGTTESRSQAEIYELSLDTEFMLWKLERVHLED